MSEYCKERIYPNSVPEFRNLHMLCGKTVIEVRYRNDAMGYIGKWMPVKAEKEQKE